MEYTQWPHRRLNLWKCSMELAKMTYETTRTFPTFEQFGLAAQMQKAAVSVPSNIAEGLARRTTKDQTRHLYIAQGSLSELDTQVELSRMIGYIDEETMAKIQELIHQTQMLLHGLIRSKNS